MFSDHAHLFAGLVEGLAARPAPPQPVCWVLDGGDQIVYEPPCDTAATLRRRSLGLPADAPPRFQQWDAPQQARALQRLLGADPAVDSVPPSWTLANDYCRRNAGVPGQRIVLGQRGWLTPSGSVVWDDASRPTAV